ncbi:MAG: hypothetical protein ABSF62_07270 [Bryobacteraceae bacterium]
MIIQGKTKFIAAPFSSEQELETVVQSNAEFIFGPDSIYLAKSVIRTPDGTGTIPGGFVVDIAARRWFIIEAELASHSVWNHIAPQVAKQITAASQPTSRRELTEIVVNRVKENAAFLRKFKDFDIREIDIRQFLADIFAGNPIVGIPIDEVGSDLREWAKTVRVEVRLWVVRKLVEFENPNNVIYEVPEEYRPVLDTSPDSDESARGYKYYDISLADLLENHLLTPGQSLQMFYKPQGGERKQYEAIVSAAGSLETLGRTFSAPSYAALACMQNAGSDRETVNGWIKWKDLQGYTLSDLREQLLQRTKQPLTN